ncbi:MAG: hypothetical protein HOH76_00220 [Hellea sp.]|jgi:hypothetical protein|nr:hypothetical protein [Hellea sp.]
MFQLREASYFSLSMVPEPTQWTTEEKAEAKSYPETAAGMSKVYID